MTEISDGLSGEINGNYARLFSWFQEHPELCDQPLFRQAILRHLPQMVRDEPWLRRRLDRLPPKYRFAILAAEIGTSLVYHGDREADFAEMLKRHLRRQIPAK